MPPIETYTAFVGAALLLLLLPGPAVLYITTRSVVQGKVAGVTSVLGISLATLVHVAGAMAGISAILASSAVAFTTVKWVGAAYLIWLGIEALREAHRSGADALTAEPGNDTSDDTLFKPLSLPRVFLDGFLVNFFNPKTAIFVMAFIPQFIDPASPHPTLALGVLGLTLVFLGFVTDTTYALVAGQLGSRLRSSPSLRRRRAYTSAVIYLGLGAATALGGRRAS